MRRTYLKAMLFALAVVAAPALSYAADSPPVPITRAPAVTVAPAVAVAPAVSDTIVITEPSPVIPAPVVRYGCSRIWRCDSVICEWRRGCFGIYGYMEGPYYTLPLARRQYERHGWPVPPERRTNFTVSK
ncbi:MAG TPA: hypothetical protein VFK79_05490 [Xanthobacteraceae bacterium]|nr:hypothetical protein [Xanthobacteraceae bacterium]